MHMEDDEVSVSSLSSATILWIRDLFNSPSSSSSSSTPIECPKYHEQSKSGGGDDNRWQPERNIPTNPAELHAAFRLPSFQSNANKIQPKSSPSRKLDVMRRKRTLDSQVDGPPASRKNNSSKPHELSFYRNIVIPLEFNSDRKHSGEQQTSTVFAGQAPQANAKSQEYRVAMLPSARMKTEELFLKCIQPGGVEQPGPGESSSWQASSFPLASAYQRRNVSSPQSIYQPISEKHGWFTESTLTHLIPPVAQAPLGFPEDGDEQTRSQITMNDTLTFPKHLFVEGVTQRIQSKKAKTVGNVDNLLSSLNPEDMKTSAPSQEKRMTNHLHSKHCSRRAWIDAPSIDRLEQHLHQRANFVTQHALSPDARASNRNRNIDSSTDIGNFPGSKVGANIYMTDNSSSKPSSVRRVFSANAFEYKGSSVAAAYHANRETTLPRVAHSEESYSESSTEANRDFFGQQVIKEPREQDVLLGRGHANFMHPANQTLRMIVDEYREMYEKSCTRSEKTDLTQLIVQLAKTHDIAASSENQGEYKLLPGRFLEYRRELQGWVEVDDERARHKVSHLFRAKSRSWDFKTHS